MLAKPFAPLVTADEYPLAQSKTFERDTSAVHMRQIEAPELMVAMNKHTINYAKSLLAATPQTQLVESDNAAGWAARRADEYLKLVKKYAS